MKRRAFDAAMLMKLTRGKTALPPYRVFRNVSVSPPYVRIHRYPIRDKPGTKSLGLQYFMDDVAMSVDGFKYCPSSRLWTFEGDDYGPVLDVMDSKLLLVSEVLEDQFVLPCWDAVSLWYFGPDVVDRFHYGCPMIATYECASK